MSNANLKLKLKLKLNNNVYYKIYRFLSFPLHKEKKKKNWFTEIEKQILSICQLLKICE